MENNIFSTLPDVLLPWYQENKRDLPWRNDCDPYHIWLSEIMLQQTRVEAVKKYYIRFLQEIPTIEELASADDDLLHKLWEGLGYYSRVRNLKKAAQQIMDLHNGSFPPDYREVLRLPGIGLYTAGAICSIAFNMRTPAVDGNVLRVAARILNDATPIDSPAFKNQIAERLTETYPPQAGMYTQALMELGATVCGPNRKPDCINCPCKAFCLGKLNQTAEKLPVKSPKIQRKVEEKTVLILSCDGRYALKKRPKSGLLADMWQFPDLVGKMGVTETLKAVEEMGLRPKEIIRTVQRKHIFTHIEWQMTGIYMEVIEPAGEFEWMDAEKIRSFAALPTAFRQFWEEIDHV